MQNIPTKQERKENQKLPSQKKIVYVFKTAR